MKTQPVTTHHEPRPGNLRRATPPVRPASDPGPRDRWAPAGWVLAVLVGGLLCTAALAGSNLLDNPGFEAGIAPWVAWGDASIAQTDQVVHSGQYAAEVTGRTAEWQGAVQAIPVGLLEPGRSYRVRAWARIAGAATAPLAMTIAREDGDGLTFPRVLDADGFDDRWVELDEVYTHEVTGTLTRFDFYVHGPGPGIDLLVDDLSFEPLPLDWQSEADARIESLRKRDLEILVVDGQGQPVASAQVDIEQLERGFPIGTVMAAGPLDTEPQYRDYITQHFNWTVHENAIKWYATEPVQGQVDYTTADTMLEWAESEGLEVRGHTIFWAPEQWQPNWVPGLDDATLAAEVDDRLEDLVSRYAGRFRHWDVNNEMLAGSFYQDRLGPDIRRWMFERTRELDPSAELFVNDFNVVSSSSKTDRYVRFIQDFDAAGIPVDAIGAQGHFTDVDPWGVKVRLDKLGALGKPVWITEFDVVQADENDHADALEDFFRMAYSHPAVEGIVLWGFWAGSHWRGPDAALIDLDWTVNAAGQRFEALMAEWWSDETVTTDLAGAADARVFHGTYRIDVTAAGFPARELTVGVPADSGPLQITVDLDVLHTDGFESLP
ncbi:endo-1,4-beta-xylanase [Halomonas denitrificans]|nr:endo-1,4-beta-xylanase [Halomonas denitrificans]